MTRKKIMATVLLFLSGAGPAAADCVADIKSIMEMMTTAGAYHVKTRVTSGGFDTRMEGKVRLPDHFDMGTPQGRMILTPEGMWMQTGGAWQQMPATMRDSIKSMMTQGMNMSVSNMTSAQCLGNQNYEGGTYAAYSFNSSGTLMGIESKASVTLYADSGGKPAWMVVDGEAMGQKSLTVQQIIFDNSIVISPPK
jgi:hypothetical protein